MYFLDWNKLNGSSGFLNKFWFVVRNFPMDQIILLNLDMKQLNADRFARPFGVKRLAAGRLLALNVESV